MILFQISESEISCDHLYCCFTSFFPLCLLFLSASVMILSAHLGGPEHMFHVFAPPVVKDEPASVSVRCL